MLEKKIYRLTEGIRWKYIQIFLSFQWKQCNKISQNVTKTYREHILHFDWVWRKNTTEVAQLMQQMLLILTVKVIFKITLLFLSQIVFRFQTQPKKIKALNINLSLGCFILASAARQKHSLHIIDIKINIAKLLLNSNPINIRLYEMQVHILRDQNFTGSSVLNTHVWAYCITSVCALISCK